MASTKFDKLWSEMTQNQKRLREGMFDAIWVRLDDRQRKELALRLCAALDNDFTCDKKGQDKATTIAFWCLMSNRVWCKPMNKMLQ